MSALGAVGYILVGLDLLRRALDEGDGVRRPPLGAVPNKGRNGLGPVSGKLVKSLTIDDRIRRISKLTKEAGREPRVREAALRVLTKRCGPTWCTKEKDWTAEAKGLFGYCRDQVRYTRDPVKHDTYVAGVRTLFDWHGGDCDDMTIALGGLLLSVGFDVDLIVVQTTGNNSWNHIYLAAILPDGKSFIPLDPSMDKPAGWEVPRSMVVKRKVVRV
jgi:hypothetical protein